MSKGKLNSGQGLVEYALILVLVAVVVVVLTSILRPILFPDKGIDAIPAEPGVANVEQWVPLYPPAPGREVCYLAVHVTYGRRVAPDQIVCW